MKQSTSQQLGRVTLLTVNLVIVLSISVVPQNPSRLAGDLWVMGGVTLNNIPAVSGVTVFNNSQIKTTRNSTATVNLGKLGRIKLEPDADLVLQFAANLIGGTQKTGLIAVSANQGTKTKVTTPHVLVESDGTKLGLVSIEVKPDCTCVVVNRGAATLTAGGKVTQMAPGQAVSFDKNGPEKVGNCEGLKAAGLARPIAIVGAVTAATLIPLTRESVNAVRGTTATSTSSVAGETTNQSPVPPTATATNNPTTPVKPTPPFKVCDCLYDKDGVAVAPDKRIFICHVGGNGNRETTIVTCAALTAHFNLNATPRAGHLQDACDACRP